MERKRIILSTILLCALLCTMGVHAQMVISIMDPNESLTADSIDRMQFVAQYRLSFVGDTSKPENSTEETMMLQVGRKSARFYSYSKFVSDSILRDMARKNDGKFHLNHADQPQGKVSWQLFKNFPDGMVTTLDRIGSSSFRCEEEHEQPEWELLPDTLTFLSFPCRKARCSFKGREYEAWYTAEIPRSEGPWKLHGLPGLILKAEDSRKHYVFECTGIEKAGAEEAIRYPGKNNEPISRKNLNKLYERFAKDPIGYITATSPNVKIVIKNESGENIQPKDTPYNPIELPE